MITKEKFDFIKEKYGNFVSWAVWAKQGVTPKSNMDDMSILEPETNKSLLSVLNPDIVLVALNFSRDTKLETWKNFHSDWHYATDFKIRYALRDTPLWGAYMTDILKDYPEKKSNKVNAHLKKNPELEQYNITRFRQEISDIGATKPLLVAFGDIVYKILERNLKDLKIIKIPHYANYSNKENYREQVKSVLSSSKLI